MLGAISKENWRELNALFHTNYVKLPLQLLDLDISL